MKRGRSRPLIPPYLRKAPQALQTLWLEHRITSLDALRSRFDKPVVALDIEGVHEEGSGITSVGFAIIRDLATKLDQATKTPADLVQLVQNFEIEGHNIACGQRDGNGRYERSPLAKMHWVEWNEVEKIIAEILETVEDCTFVIYNRHTEFRAMATALSTLSPKIARWVDLEGIIGDMTGTTKKPLSLRDVMLSIGFESHIQKHTGTHSAGMDAVRTTGVLLTHAHDRRIPR